MFLLSSNNQLNTLNVYYALKQTGLPLTLDKHKSIENISMKFSNINKMIIAFKNYEDFISLPVNINQLSNCFHQLLLKYEHYLGPLKFNPMKEEITSGTKAVKLRKTHCLILIEAIKSEKNSISKDKLYKILWPRDLNVQMNKLDTHLTNVKNLLKEHFNFKFSFSSEKGNLIFYIN